MAADSAAPSPEFTDLADIREVNEVAELLRAESATGRGVLLLNPGTSDEALLQHIKELARGSNGRPFTVIATPRWLRSDAADQQRREPS